MSNMRSWFSLSLLKNNCLFIKYLVLLSIFCSFFCNLAASEAELENVAVNKPARQSSIYWGGEAKRAVDGNTDGRFDSGSVMHTSNEDSPWWEVDLKEVYDISHISIYNRVEYPDRTKDLYLFISANPFKSDEICILKEEPGVTTYHIKEQVEFPTKVNVDCKARYVRVQLANHGFLNLAEVEVYGKPAQDIQDLVLVENVALNKPAKQSSVGWGGEPKHGVDGNRDGRSLSSIFHTQKEQSPWWEVDLEETYDITRIALFNRVEAAQRVERAQNLYVFVSKEPFKSDNLEDIKKINQMCLASI